MLLKSFLFVGVGAYLALMLLLVIGQRKFLYFPPNHYISPAGVNLNHGALSFEDVTIEIKGTVSVTAWYHAPINQAPTVLFFHGNASAVYSNYDIYADLARAGYGVLAVGYPGYPSALQDKKPAPTQDLLVRSAVAHYDWLVGNKSVSADKVVLFGTSLGTGIASQLAVQRPVALLVLDAPYNSALDMGRRQFPIFPIKFLMKDQFRSDVALQGLEVPMIWTHGTNDHVIPLAQGQKLFDGYNGPKASLIIEGGEHTNLWGLGAREFILSHLSKTP